LGEYIPLKILKGGQNDEALSGRGVRAVEEENVTSMAMGRLTAR